MNTTSMLGLALAGGGFNPLAFDPAAMALTLITFLGLLFILGKFAWGPILAQIEAREKRIADAISKAEGDRAAAEKLLADYRASLANAESEIAALREKGRAEAAALRADLMAKAGADAAALTAKAKSEIDLARQQALADLRHEAVALSLAAAGKVVGRSLDGNDQRRLAEEVVAGLASGAGAR